MSELRIDNDQFPRALPAQARVGDEVTLTIRGTIHRIEAQIVDVSTIDGKGYLQGGVDTSILIAEIEAA